MFKKGDYILAINEPRNFDGAGAIFKVQGIVEKLGSRWYILKNVYKLTEIEEPVMFVNHWCKMLPNSRNMSEYETE